MSERLPIKRDEAIRNPAALPRLVADAGSNARFAWEEFFFGSIRNPHTRRAHYYRAVTRFLAWSDKRGVPLQQISPADIGQYLDGLQLSIATKKQILAGLRHFFDTLVNRHAVALNPAASVRGERYVVMEGKTPEITVPQARKLLQSIDTSNVVGLRDKCVIAVLIYTAARVGAVARIQVKDLYDIGDQYCMRFLDKGGKSREIPVRHDLQQLIFEYLFLADQQLGTGVDRPLFTTTLRKTKQLSFRSMTANDIGRMLKRRLRHAGLPVRLSPHSFRVTTITDLLTQGVPIEDVQHLAGHADPRTTRLYDRRQRKITRNIVERISV